MIKPSVTPAEVIAFLNECLAIDPEGISTLFRARVPVNRAIAQHPSIQVGVDESAPTASFDLAMLGLLNGLLGAFDDGPRKGWGPIVAVWNEGITRIEKFAATPEA